MGWSWVGQGRQSADVAVSFFGASSETCKENTFALSVITLRVARR